MAFNKKVLTIQKIQQDDVRTAVFHALDAIHAKDFFSSPNMKVLLKPNLLSDKPPERAVTTHPKVVKAVIQWVTQFNPEKIYVCDSSGGRSSQKTFQALKTSGIKAVCESEGAECIPFSKTERKIYPIKDGLVLDQIVSSNLLDEVDVIINLPKIKTHELTMLTCSIKNMFGTVILMNKSKYHARFVSVKDFTSALVDIYSVSMPQITLIDGYLAQEGRGPAAGDVVKMDLILAGYDGFALDALVCQLIGLDPNIVLYLEKGATKGLGSINLEEFEILGEDPNHVKRQFKLPHRVANQLSNVPIPRFIRKYVSKHIYKQHIKINPEKCKICGTCWKNCPVNALSPPKSRQLGKDVPKWDPNKCIACYCCAELCPYEAITFKIPFVRNTLMSWFGVGIGVLLSVIILLIIIF